ncbi:unnamed protein product [Arabis nemorensis]|uniref:Uncharacterized protein n=1 Tax=Arabis nemorensis TaxID=586526 RepID=A0A565BD05_9BRAS|nr:unnamed protein product [Arabis nemorensis]
MRSEEASSPDPREERGKKMSRNRDNHRCFLPDSFTVVVSGKNEGFAGDNNLCMTFSGHRLYLLRRLPLAADLTNESLSRLTR